jgi:TPR repeat protein
MKPLLAVLILILLTACGAPQDLGAGSEPHNFNMGLDAYKRGDFAIAVDELQPLAESGNTNAQFLLGFMYGHGEGVPQDDIEAAKWYRKAAAQGHDSAQNNLGFLYEYGLGVTYDQTEAKKWYRKAAAQGNANAQRNFLMVGRNFSERITQDLLWREERARENKVQGSLGISQYDLPDEHR